MYLNIKMELSSDLFCLAVERVLDPDASASSERLNSSVIWIPGFISWLGIQCTGATFLWRLSFGHAHIYQICVDCRFYDCTNSQGRRISIVASKKWSDVFPKKTLVPFYFQTFRFLDGRSKKAHMLKRNPRKVTWTVLYRRKHRKVSSTAEKVW